MSFFRTAPTRKLIVLLGTAGAALAAGVAIAVAAGGAGTPPPAQPLPAAVHDALGAPAPDGVTADVSFTNNLLPTGSLTGQAGSALITGATGRLWVTNDGRGRIELQSDAGDVQIVWNDTQVTVYDASSNTAYRVALPQHSGAPSSTDSHTPPTLDEITKALSDAAQYWAIGAAVPTVIGGQGAYDASASPKSSAGLLGRVELAWDAQHGVPLKAAVYSRGSAAPVLSLAATGISFGAVSDSDVDVAPPAGAKVVDIPTSGTGGSSSPSEVTGVGAVQAALPFTLAAPSSLGGQQLDEARLIGSGDHQGALLTYGQGLGAVAIVERAADASGNGSASAMSALPGVAIGAATGHELTTPLGTVVTWSHGGVDFVLAGSIAAADAEADAAAVR